jgi:hypothetical protein
VNLYQYVGENPLNAWDPLGLCEYGLGVSATAAAVGGATVGAGLYGSDNYDDKWYDRFGVYGTFGGVIGASIGVSGNVSKFDRGAFRGASTGLGVALGGGIDLYKSTDPNAPADPFGDAGDLLREAIKEGRQCDSGGASLSGGLKASFGATISINRTGVITPGSVGRAIKRAWNYFF